MTSSGGYSAARFTGILTSDWCKHMAQNIDPLYHAYLDCSKAVLNALLKSEDFRLQHTAAHSQLADYAIWEQVLRSRRESAVLRRAINEFQSALYALAIGQYRHAFIGLRLFFELSLACVRFSLNELELRQWESDARDINWQQLINTDDGIFSKNVVKAFNCDLVEHAPQFRVLGEKVYRECSEYVHGNASTHEVLPSTIEYAEGCFAAWYAKGRSIHMVVLFALSYRYLPELTKLDREKLKASVEEELGHIPHIRGQLLSD